jgi:hypothetical protein
MSMLTMQNDIRPDIIVAVTWDNWQSQWIKRIFRLEDFVEFIAHVFIRVVNMRRRTRILIITVMTTLTQSNMTNRMLSPVQTIKSILSFQTLSMYSNVALIRERGESHGPSGMAKWPAVRLSSGSKFEPKL